MGGVNAPLSDATLRSCRDYARGYAAVCAPEADEEAEYSDQRRRVDKRSDHLEQHLEDVMHKRGEEGVEWLVVPNLTSD